MSRRRMGDCKGFAMEAKRVSDEVVVKKGVKLPFYCRFFRNTFFLA